MNLAHIVQADDAGQVAGAFHNNPVVEHFDLDVGAFDAIIAMLCKVNSYGKLSIRHGSGHWPGTP